MLNCCIYHKLSHGKQQQQSQSTTTSDTTIFHTPTSSPSFSQRRQDSVMSQQGAGQDDGTHDGSSTSSDEFYEAQESIQTDTDTKTDSHTTSQPGSGDVTSSLLSQKSTDSLGSIKPRNADLQPVAGGNDPLSLLGKEEEEDDFGVRDQESECTERSGALRPYKDLVLIATNEPMYEPAVQVSFVVM